MIDAWNSTCECPSRSSSSGDEEVPSSAVRANPRHAVCEGLQSPRQPSALSGRPEKHGEDLRSGKPLAVTSRTKLLQHADADELLDEPNGFGRTSARENARPGAP